MYIVLYIYISGIGSIVFMLSEVSGGQVNPAVSFALFLDQRISFIKLLGYTASQFTGGFIGAGKFTPDLL